MTRKKLRRCAAALIFSTLITLSVAPPVAAGSNAVEVVRPSPASFMERIYEVLWGAMELLGFHLQSSPTAQPSPGLAAKYGSSYDPFG